MSHAFQYSFARECGDVEFQFFEIKDLGRKNVG
jgi:hypothetical protein